MSAEIKVSVIIPVYNMEAWLRNCLDSVFSQTFIREMEVLCIDDGSTDQSLSILREYESRHNNIRLLTQENQGAGPARNNGILHARGEYLAFMDPDDYYPGYDVLQKLYETAKRNNAEICGGSLAVDRGSYVELRVSSAAPKQFEQEGWLQYRDYQWDYFYQRFLYKRELLSANSILFPPYLRFQDPPFFVRTMITAGQFYAVSFCTYCYRVGHKGISWNKRRTADLIRALTDNLQMSAKADLRVLHCSTVHRLLSDFRRDIIPHLQEPEILLLLASAQDAIVREWITDEKEKSGVMLYLSVLSEKAQKADQQISSLRKNAEGDQVQIKKLKESEKSARNALAAERSRLTDMENSRSFQIGRMITWPGRALRDQLHQPRS